MPTVQQLEAEIAALRATNAALQQAHEEQRRQLTQTASLLRALADYAPMVLYAKDVDGRFTLSNRLHATLLGRTPDQVVGKLESDLLDADVAAEIQAVMDRVVSTGTPSVSEFEIPIDDRERVFLEHIFPLGRADGSGNNIGIGGVAIDVTERKRAEEAVRVFEALVHHSPDGVLVRPNTPTAPMFCNPALRRILALPPDAAAEDAAAMLLDIVPGTTEFMRIDGVRVDLELTMFAIPGAAGGRGAAATQVRDVTRLHTAIRERERQDEVIRQQQAELIAEMSAQVLPLAHGVLMLPLIGTLDEARSLHVREAVLDGIVRHQARVIILDLTGLRAVDTTPAYRIIQLIEAVKMIGARTVLTGIQPAAAVAFTEHGMQLDDSLIVLGTLQDAVQVTLAMARKRRR
ncbi:PAS domain-containing protein [Nannocystis sp. ILAH1]|uniref:PAS domain-containing protein n=1 Tax=unclassified Nannocystis TaxID=2627009 RepID=UPI002270C752|nr:MULTISPECIES: PAS domain-containing protein [unclassified Nannocystis]MCY0987533.1 PAS domain-containing protein [Nannocystis sp. ILAH1]MCY1070671.1 PAS domain-containing protein [Nannocystis sp. RBIL2]